MNKYVIIPVCSDLNRGDQALVWESIRLFKDAGKKGDFYLISEKNEPIHQSLNHGLNIISPILEHPSRIYKNKNNLEYTWSLKFKWGIIALLDLFRSILLLSSYSRGLGKLLLNKNIKNSLSVFEESEGIIVKGGGFIHAYGGLTSSYYIYFSLFHIFLAQSLNKPVYIMPNSIGPFEGPLVKWMVKKALKKSKLVTVRETFSKKMILEELGVNVNHIPDLAFYLENTDVDKINFFQKYNIPCNRKLVAVTMRPHRFPKSLSPSEDYIRFKKSLAEFISWLYNEGYMPVLIEHVLAINYNESDWECIREVKEYLKDGEYVVVSNREYTCNQLKCIYSFFDYIVGTRFHSMIFSMANGVPGIAITYTGNKGQGIMHDMKLDDYCISIDNVTSPLLKSTFNKLVKNQEMIKQNINNYIEYADNARKCLIEYIN